jgi:hypothetical protein
MKYSELNVICKKYGCFINSFDQIYIFESEKYTKIGRIYYKPKVGFYYPQTLSGKNLGGEECFEPCLVRLLTFLGYIK